MSRPSDVLTREQRLQLTQRSDVRAALLLLTTWLWIFALLLAAGRYPNVFTIVLVFLLLPGRQLSLAVLMHEAGHHTLFRTEWLNRVCGQWLCALPTFADLDSYARGHLEHHRKAGTHDDPDLPNYAAYPVTGDSFKRKVIRDLTGQTGFKLLSGIIAGATGVIGGSQRQNSTLLLQQILAQLLLFAALQLMGVGWTWWLWFGTFLTTYMLVIRLRQVAEHAAVSDLYDLDPRCNTRTVVAPWWQHFLIAPSYVNYHMEHHFMPGVPCYRLPELRRLLRAAGYLDSVPECHSYADVLSRAVRAA